MDESLIKKEKPTVIKCNKANLIYNILTFYSYSDNGKLNNLSFKTTYSYLSNFYDDLKKND